MAHRPTQIDCLLIHIGVPSIARGLYAIYYFLKSQNINTQLIIIDEDNYNSFMEEIITLENVKLVGISLHWHPQIVSSVKVAELLKCMDIFKRAKIVFGGLTASVFKYELIKIPYIDFVVYGDGILPIKLLYDYIAKKESIDYSLRDIPNLVFQQNGRIITSEKRYVVNDETLTELELQALEETNLFKKSRNVIAIGRGCFKTCHYCGGSKYSYCKFIGESSPLTRDVSSIHRLIHTAIDKGHKSLYFATDYDGKCQMISEYLSPYDLSNFDNITIGAWGLPNIENLQAIFHNTKFPNNINFTIEISPEIGSDKSRQSLGGNYFSNKELILFIAIYFAHFSNFRLAVFFSYFQPGNNYFNPEERKFIIELYRRFPNYILNKKLIIYFFPLSTDPGSIMQSSKIQDIAMEVNSLNDYIHHLLNYKSNVGNFLAHFPVRYGKDGANFLKDLYLWENILREKYTKAFYGLIYFFDNFKDYNQFLVSCVEKINKIISEPESNTFPLKNILGLDKFNILGFHFSNDETYNNDSLTTLIWVNAVINQLTDIKNNSENLADTNIAYPIDDAAHIHTKQDLLNYILEYLQLKICLKKIKIITYYSKNKKIHKDLPTFNHLKIESLKRSGLNSRITPLVNQFCQFIKTSHLTIQYPVLTPKFNLLGLGKLNFCKYLLNVTQETFNDNKMNSIIAVLDRQNLESFHSGIPEYWNKLQDRSEDTLNNALSELIVRVNIPVEEIITKMPEDISRLHISKFFGVFSDNCSIDLIDFFIHYYLNRAKISHYKPSPSIDNSDSTTYILMTQSDQTVTGYLSPLENELCDLCSRNKLLSDIFEILKQNNKGLNKMVFMDMVSHLYKTGILI